MNALDFIFRLFHIPNVPIVVVLTPPRLFYMPSIDCANLYADYVNSFVDYGNKFANYSNFFC